MRVDELYRIVYLVAHGDAPSADTPQTTPGGRVGVVPNSPESFTLFQGFGRPLVGAVPTLLRLARMPRDAREFWASRDVRLGLSVSGNGHRIVPIELPALADALEHFVSEGYPFIVVLSPRSSTAYVERLIASHEQPILLVPFSAPTPAVIVAAGAAPPSRDAPEPAASKGVSVFAVTPSSRPSVPDAAPDETLSVESLRAFVRRAAEHLERHPTLAAVGRRVVDALATQHADIFCALELRSRGHQVTHPNEATLERLSYALKPWDGVPIPPRDDTGYVEAIAESSRIITEARHAFFRDYPDFVRIRSFDALLTVPSLLRHCYRAEFRRDLRGRDRQESTLARKIAKTYASQSRYAMDIEAPSARDVFGTPAGMSMVEERRNELSLYTCGIALRASADCVPVIRVPPAANRYHDTASKATDAARGGGQNRVQRLNRFMRKLSDALTESVPATLREIADSAGPRVKIAADAPLEWLKIQGTPLMLRKEVSRIPTTPGNLFFRDILGPPEVVTPLEAARHVLHVRSFRRDDPIREYVRSACELVLDQEHTAGRRVVELTTVDVQSRDEFVRALNAFEGAVMIFDGHGAHRRHDTVGTIAVGQDDVDAWTLTSKTRVPPVVVLSACDTHPLDGSHSSVAAGFLVAGAATVLATTMPVDARYASDFIARLLLRLNQWLPIALGGPAGMVRWSTLISGLQRRVHMTEVLRAVDGKPGVRISHADFTRISLDVGMEIESGGASWYEALTAGIASASGAGEDHVRRTVSEWAFITDALRYIQLGNPESIVITR